MRNFKEFLYLNAKNKVSLWLPKKENRYIFSASIWPNATDFFRFSSGSSPDKLSRNIFAVYDGGYLCSSVLYHDILSRIIFLVSE